MECFRLSGKYFTDTVTKLKIIYLNPLHTYTIQKTQQQTKTTNTNTTSHNIYGMDTIERKE